MATLYEIKGENTDHELTSSLARSLKKGLLLPTEKKFNLLEQDIAVLRQEIEIDTNKQTSELKDQLARLETTLAGLTKLFRTGVTLTLATLVAVIVAILMLLFLR